MRPTITRLTIVGFALLLAAPLASAAQQAGKVPRVGYLSMAPGPSPRSQAFRQGLRDLGHVEGQTVTVEYRFAQGKVDRQREQAVELVRLKSDVIVAGGPGSTRAAMEATTTTPIVMATGPDPVATGFVMSLARPGRNVTGLSSLSRDITAKRLELLKESFPTVSRVSVLWNPAEPGAEFQFSDTQGAARALGLRLQSLEVRGPEHLERALQAAARERADALIVLADAVTAFHQGTLVALANKNRLRAMYWDGSFAEAGGLMAYGADARDLSRRAAVFVDKILKGAKPANLPVEQPTKFELVINMKTAKMLGLTIPPPVLVRADRLIE